MLAVSSLVVEIAAWSGAVVALGTAVRALTGWSITRYLVGKLVIEPVKHGALSVVDEHLSPRLDGMEERLAGKLAGIEAELSYNGGRTVKDMVRATAERLEATAHQVDTISAQAQVMADRMDAIEHRREQAEEIDHLAQEGRVERRKP